MRCKGLPTAQPLSATSWNYLKLVGLQSHTRERFKSSAQEQEKSFPEDARIENHRRTQEVACAPHVDVANAVLVCFVEVGCRNV